MIKIPVFVGPDVVGFDIGENTIIKNESLGPVKHQALRGYLHHHTVAACVRHSAEILLDDIRFRRGIGGGNGFIPYNGFNRSDQPHLISRVFQDRFHHISGSGFALGSGNTDRLQLLRRISEPCGRDKSHGVTGIFHTDHCDVRRNLNIFLHHKSFYPFCKDVGNKLMSVRDRAPDTDEEGTLPGLPGIVYHGCNLLLRVALAAGIFYTFQ